MSSSATHRPPHPVETDGETPTEPKKDDLQQNQNKSKMETSRKSSFLFWSANLYLEDKEEEEDEGEEANPTQDSYSQTPSKSIWRRICATLCHIYRQYDFLILIVLAICLARAYPPLGAVYLQPQITSTWIAVIISFLLAGLGLKTEEFSKAFQQIYFNIYVQVFNFGVVSAVVFGVSRALLAAGALSTSLSNGMVVCACLCLTINMSLVFTKTSGGDEASAIFNATAGNMIGVFLTPPLILGYLGVTGEVNMGDVFYKLAVRVVCPLIVGQIIRRFSPAVVEWYKTHKQLVRQAQQLTLVFIVYTVFCGTFASNSDAVVSIVDLVVMVVVEFACLVGLMLLAWYSLRFFFRNEPKLCITGLYGCTHKTVAMGIPLINAIYENDDTIGLITLPLLIWHSLQLVLGSFLAPKLSAWIILEEERLGITHDDDIVNTINDDDDDGVDAGNDEKTKPTGGDDPKDTVGIDETRRLSSILDGSHDTQDRNDKATSTPDVENGQSDEESL